MAGNDGEMLYYAERLEALERKSKDQISSTAITIIADYYNTKGSFELTKKLFEKHKEYLLNLSKELNEKSSAKDYIQSHRALEKIAEAVLRLNDTANAQLLLNCLQEIEDKALSSHLELSEIIYLRYGRILVDWIQAQVMNRPEDLPELIKKMEAIKNNPHTPETLKNYVSFTISDNKAYWFLEQNKPDSALYYINLLQADPRTEHELYTKYMVQKILR